MRLTFHYTQDRDGNISNLQSIRPVSFWEDKVNHGTIGDDLLYGCLRDYKVNEDRKGFSFNLEYDSTKQIVFEYLGGFDEQSKE